jgi:phosphoglycolate phosphatase-like HAD superfamily hydrolase
MRELAGRLESSQCVLFDFDGPLCRLFPGDSSEPLAEELRRLVRLRGAGELLTRRVSETIDPQVVLRAADEALPGGKLVAELEQRLAEMEAAAAAIVPLAQHGADVLVPALVKAGVGVAVATNNSPLAVAVHLRRMALYEYFDPHADDPHIYGRIGDPKRLKPDPDCLKRALRGLKAEAEDAVMIGDTTTDLDAAREARVAFVGYARDADEAGPLWAAGAQLVISDFALLAAMIPMASS